MKALSLTFLFLCGVALMPVDSSPEKQHALLKNVQLQARAIRKMANKKEVKFSHLKKEAKRGLHADIRARKAATKDVRKAIDGILDVEQEESKSKEEATAIFKKAKHVKRMLRKNKGRPAAAIREMMKMDKKAAGMSVKIDHAATAVDSQIHAAGRQVGKVLSRLKRTNGELKSLEEDEPTLGEVDGKTFRERLHIVEKRSNRIAKNALKKEKRASRSWEAETKKLKEQSKGALAAMALLKKAKARMDKDLHGHKDRKLERKIFKRLEKAKKDLGRQRKERSETHKKHLTGMGLQGLKAAEHSAEEYVNGLSSPKGTPQEVADLSAVSDYAESLALYQASASKELEKVRKTLKK